MWLSFPWKPTKRMIGLALMLALASLGLAGLSGLIPPGLGRDVVRGTFGAVLLVAVVRAVDARRRRAEEEGWGPIE